MRTRGYEYVVGSGGGKKVTEGAWRRHRSWRVGRPKPGPASKAVRKEAVCELTGTIEGKRSRDEGEGGIGCFIAVKRREDPMPDREVHFGRLIDKAVSSGSRSSSKIGGLKFVTL